MIATIGKEDASAAAGTMAAIVQDVYGSADGLRLRRIARPTPGAGEVLLRVQAAGVDRGVWHVMTGKPYLMRVMGFGFRGPKVKVLGREVAGTVEAVGAGVTRFEPGDAVFGTAEGSFAEFVCAREARLAYKPANLTFEQAAAVPVSAITALQGIRDAGRAQAGQRVLVTGAGGGVGTFAVQIARAFGASVTGVCSTSKVGLVRSLGAEHVIDHTREDFTTSGLQYDLILDTAGNRPLAQLRKALTPRGTAVIVGGEGGDRWLGGFDRPMLRAPLLSLFVGQTLRGLLAKETSEDLVALRALIEAGEIVPVIDRVYPLAQAADALRYLSVERPRGKVVVKV